MPSSSQEPQPYEPATVVMCACEHRLAENCHEDDCCDASAWGAEGWLAALIKDGEIESVLAKLDLPLLFNLHNRVIVEQIRRGVERSTIEEALRLVGS